MRDTRQELPELCSVTYYPSRLLPAKALLAAVLESAYRELNAYFPLHIREECVRWFLDPAYGANEEGFTYEFIKEALDLNEIQIEFISIKVRATTKELGLNYNWN